MGRLWKQRVAAARRGEEAAVTEPSHEPPHEVAPEALAVRDLMSATPYAVGEDESVLVAWEVLERSGQRHLAVVREDGCCAGVLAHAELAVACAAPAATLSGRRLRDLVRGRRTAAVHADDSARRAAAVMTEGGTDALPVTDVHGHLVGLLTAGDFVAAAAGLPRRAEGAPPVGSDTAPFPFLPGLPPSPPGRGPGISIP
jgi:CBS domain-containing protein